MPAVLLVGRLVAASSSSSSSSPASECWCQSFFLQSERGAQAPRGTVRRLTSTIVGDPRVTGNTLDVERGITRRRFRVWVFLADSTARESWATRLSGVVVVVKSDCREVFGERSR
ncbi:hypothetical protein QR685DRAFT_574427 [Neurospora intermedia]|uniref:Secreted protein n=1 Tax=Neurospora intermedia TaxID=5142 RepID=A0ABR3D4K0_NEUIN